MTSSVAIHPQFPLYEIHADGTVRRRVKLRYFERGGQVVGRVLKSGYRQFKLKDVDGKRRSVRANRLILEAFEGPPPSPAHQAAHGNGTKLDNSLGNLSWKTPKANMADQEMHGTRLRGKRHAQSIGSSDLAAAVLSDIAERGRCYDAKALASRHGISVQMVRKIKSGRHWSVTPDLVARMKQGTATP